MCLETIFARKGQLVKAIKADMSFAFGREVARNSMHVDMSKDNLSRLAWEVREKNFRSFLRRKGAGGGLHVFLDVEQLLRVPVPRTLSPRVFGALCSLVTGHCALLEHKFKLGLSFTPTCICLEGDESVSHYMFECPLYESERKKLMLKSWDSIVEFAIDTAWLC